jgi:hypothetical protein
MELKKYTFNQEGASKAIQFDEFKLAASDYRNTYDGNPDLCIVGSGSGLESLVRTSNSEYSNIRFVYSNLVNSNNYYLLESKDLNAYLKSLLDDNTDMPDDAPVRIEKTISCMGNSLINSHTLDQEIPKHLISAYIDGLKQV